MGNEQSSPLETQDEYYPGGSEQYAIDQQTKIDDAERTRAEEAARKAEADRKRQEEEEARKLQEFLAEIKAKADFVKPSSPTLQLKVETSGACGSCDITIQPGLSSSTVILSRDILGKIDVPKKSYPPSNLPKDAVYDGDWFDYGQNRHENYARAFDGIPYSRASNGSVLYNPPYPGSDFPEVLSKADIEKMAGKVEYAKKYSEQSYVENANRKKIDAENALEKKRVRLWNPSETKGDKGAVAVNYKTHGALTKIFLKPTIPFSITYGINADVEKAERKEKERLKKKKEEEDKKKKKEEEEAKKAEGK
jgi:hypothetical protein